MNLPKLEACGNFVREARTPENLAGFAVAEIPLYAQSDASGIAAEISRRCNEYDELKARVAELENWASDIRSHLRRCDKSLPTIEEVRDRIACLSEQNTELLAVVRAEEAWRDEVSEHKSDDLRVLAERLRSAALKKYSFSAARKNGGAA